MLIVDDMPNKQGNAERFLTESSTTRDTRYVLSLKEDGESAINLYQEVRKQEPKEEQNKVVIMLDGDLKKGIYRYGDEVAEKLMEISASNEWESPYLVGMSNDPNANWMLRQRYPQNYIDTFDDWAPKEQKAALLDAIDYRLAPPQTPPQK